MGAIKMYLQHWCNCWCNYVGCRNAAVKCICGTRRGDKNFLSAVMAENNYSWWKLTFLRKKKSTPKVLIMASENPDIYAASNHENQQEGVLAADGGSCDGSEREFNSRLEKIVDKNTKGKHVKVSHSGRFKEKKKVRATLSENPNFFADGERDEK